MFFRLTIIFILSTLLSQPVIAGQSEPIPYTDFQLSFMRVIKDYSQKYKAAENELQKSSLVTERHKAFNKLKGDPKKIKDWYGVIEKMGTNGEGKAYIVLNLSPNLITFSTWNNSFSDINDKTLIPQTSPVFKSLSKMKVGNVVKFSGRLKAPKNMTEAGKMQEPDFLFIFKSIDYAGKSAID